MHLGSVVVIKWTNRGVPSLAGTLPGIPEVSWTLGEALEDVDPDIGPQVIGLADEGNVRLTARPAVRNKACCLATYYVHFHLTLQRHCIEQEV